MRSRGGEVQVKGSGVTGLLTRHPIVLHRYCFTYVGILSSLRHLTINLEHAGDGSIIQLSHERLVKTK